MYIILILITCVSATKFISIQESVFEDCPNDSFARWRFTNLEETLQIFQESSNISTSEPGLYECCKDYGTGEEIARFRVVAFSFPNCTFQNETYHCQMIFSLNANFNTSCRPTNLNFTQTSFWIRVNFETTFEECAINLQSIDGDVFTIHLNKFSGNFSIVSFPISVIIFVCLFVCVCVACIKIIVAKIRFNNKPYDETRIFVVK